MEPKQLEFKETEKNTESPRNKNSNCTLDHDDGNCYTYEGYCHECNYRPTFHPLNYMSRLILNILMKKLEEKE